MSNASSILIKVDEKRTLTSHLERRALIVTEIGVGVFTAHVEEEKRVCDALAVVLRRCEREQDEQ